MKVFLTEHDSFNYTIYDEDETFDMFGFTLTDDEEYFIDIPKELVYKYKKVFNEFWELNNELDTWKKGK